jgi:hypothetical protein
MNPKALSKAVRGGRALKTATLAAEATALIGATIHTMVPGQEARPGIVLIEDGRIAAVGEEVEIPEGVEKIDLSGRHLIPGLIDGIAYHDPEHDLLYAAQGVLYLRDHGNDLGRIFESRERSKRPDQLGPVLGVCGALFDGLPPATAEALIAQDAHQLEHELEQLLEEEPDFLAFHNHLPAEAWRKLCELGLEQSLQVWGPPGPAGRSPAELTAAGQRGIVGLEILERIQGQAPGSIESACQELARSGVALTPLLLASANAWTVEEEDLELLAPAYEVLWKAAEQKLAATSGGPTRQLSPERQGLLLALHRHGVALVPGSGAPHPGLFPGKALLEELRLWQEAGIPAADVLAAATIDAARALGVDGERGTIEPDRAADLVVLREDPCEDIARLQLVEGVVRAGELYPREVLDGRLGALREAQQAARSARVGALDVPEPRLPKGEILLSGHSESFALGERLGGERWAVVRDDLGRLFFCGRSRRAPRGEQPELALEIEQCFVRGKLESFRATLSTAGSTLAARGLQVAGQMRIERRLNEVFVDNRSFSGHPAFVDVGSSTAALLLGLLEKPGTIPVLRFHEGLEPELVHWRWQDEGDGVRKASTPDGAKLFRFGPRGEAQSIAQQSGAMEITTVLRDLGGKMAGEGSGSERASAGLRDLWREWREVGKER